MTQPRNQEFYQEDEIEVGRDASSGEFEETWKAQGATGIVQHIKVLRDRLGRFVKRRE